MMTHWAGKTCWVSGEKRLFTHTTWRSWYRGPFLSFSFFFVMLLVSNASFPDWFGLGWGTGHCQCDVVPEDFSFVLIWFSTQWSIYERVFAPQRKEARMIVES